MIEAAEPAKTYDKNPYPGHAYGETHPDHLAAIGTLFGMNPTDVQCCSVLEVGCGDGNNLIPMAVALPRSSFLGIDFSSAAIQKGQAIAGQLGLSNIQFECRDLLDVSADIGQFDYIIAHGFYSWVPPQVQAKLLTLCGECLSLNGIAFVSYNTYPGGHLREAVRDLMLFQVHRSASESFSRTQLGLDFLSTIAKSASPDTLWKKLLESELERLKRREDSVTFHDELNEYYYGPLYFWQFVNAAKSNNLQFLSEARLHDVLSPSVEPQVAQKLSDMANGDVVAYQQYLDFAIFQSFRRTLLCREGIQLNRQEISSNLSKLFIGSPLKAASQLEGSPAKFVNSRAAGNVETNNAVLISALKQLEAAWPGAESFQALLNQVCDNLSDRSELEVESELADGILQLGLSGLIDIRTFYGSAVNQVSLNPSASPLSRLQAGQQSRVTTLLHTNVEITDPSARKLLTMLDGRSGQSQLAKTFSVGRQLDVTKSQISILLSGFRDLGLFAS